MLYGDFQGHSDHYLFKVKFTANNKISHKRASVDFVATKKALLNPIPNKHFTNIFRYTWMAQIMHKRSNQKTRHLQLAKVPFKLFVGQEICYRVRDISSVNRIMIGVRKISFRHIFQEISNNIGAGIQGFQYTYIRLVFSF